jgi:Protein of unknown function (DUF1559)
MDASHSFGEDVYFIPDVSPARTSDWSRHGKVRWGVLVFFGFVAAIGLVPSVLVTARALRRDQCKANLTRLGLAFHEYEQAHGHFPAPALLRSDGTPLLSWRISLLPLLGYRPLYERFHLDEPWDSPHNRFLIAEMPPELACPGTAAPRRDGQTGYKLVVGPKIGPSSVNTPFDASRGVGIREITDGTSNTILVMETDALVPWSKPDDLHWQPGGPPPELKSPHSGGAHVVLADGQTRFLKNIQPTILTALLTVNAGEVISSDS